MRFGRLVRQFRSVYLMMVLLACFSYFTRTPCDDVRHVQEARESTQQTDEWTNDIETVRPYLESFSRQITESANVCETIKIGEGWGVHELCNTIPPKCNFYSFGISDDYSFDVTLAKIFSCRGFAADPTVKHPSTLHPQVTFHQIGAKMLEDGVERDWMSTSMPSLMKWKGDTWVDVLKMDCEGCEYSLAKDVFLEDPSFFNKVGQLAIEIHVSKVWLNSTEHLYSFGMLLKQLKEANLRLAHADVGTCHPNDEAPGCMDALRDLGIPCGNGTSCHNYLFARSTHKEQ